MLERAYQEDRVLVTSNVDDFVKLAAAREIHAGIVLVERGGLLRDEQIALVREVAAEMPVDFQPIRATFFALVVIARPWESMIASSAKA